MLVSSVSCWCQVCHAGVKCVMLVSNAFFWVGTEGEQPSPRGHMVPFPSGASDAFFWVGTEGEQPSPRGHMVPFPSGASGEREMVLPQFTGENVLFRLPDGVKVSQLRWISVWCRRFTVNFGSLRVPENLILPKKRKLSELSRLAHGVRSGNVTLLDAKTIYIPNLHYDGRAPDAYFWVGKGTPDRTGRKIPNEKKSLSVIEAYEGVDIELVLPDNLTIYDIDYLALWCVRYTENFGDVKIPSAAELFLPPALGQTQVKSGSALQPAHVSPKDQYDHHTTDEVLASTLTPSLTTHFTNTTATKTDHLNETLSVTPSYGVTKSDDVTEKTLLNGKANVTASRGDFELGHDEKSTTKVDESTVTSVGSKSVTEKSKGSETVTVKLDIQGTGVEKTVGNEVNSKSNGTEAEKATFKNEKVSGWNTTDHEKSMEGKVNVEESKSNLTDSNFISNELEDNRAQNSNGTDKSDDFTSAEKEGEEDDDKRKSFRMQRGMLIENAKNMTENDTIGTVNVGPKEKVLSSDFYLASPVKESNGTFQFGLAEDVEKIRAFDTNDTEAMSKMNTTGSVLGGFGGRPNPMLTTNNYTFRYDADPEIRPKSAHNGSEITEIVIREGKDRYRYSVGNDHVIQHVIDGVHLEPEGLVHIESKKHWGAHFYGLPGHTDHDSEFQESTEKANVEESSEGNEGSARMKHHPKDVYSVTVQSSNVTPNDNEETTTNMNDINMDEEKDHSKDEEGDEDNDKEVVDKKEQHPKQKASVSGKTSTSAAVRGCVPGAIMALLVAAVHSGHRLNI
ncbi:uncharacterized protein LOC108673057 [Hyalella azteca]|uniref:Uncharacterized protein LOC108673057 n=1 Tax=Hyalella azteca TaxID=294128 RepID=A0A8B7NTJ1_HYAAZ|nr:uncharacterized protein LOC108673057 [Hyalella azteca]